MMHFSIPDTIDVRSDRLNNYVAYNIYVDGSFHCTVRYKQFYNFNEQLKRAFGAAEVPPFFPPKKLLPLTPQQVEERRAALEEYIQLLSQDPRISSSDLFNGFLLSAQQETQNAIVSEDAILDVYLMNWTSVKVKVSTLDSTDTVMEAFAKAVQLPENLLPYFNLYLVSRPKATRTSRSNGFDAIDHHYYNGHGSSDNPHEYTLVRQMKSFESPHLSLRVANSVVNGGTHSHYLVVRKSYWDPAYDEDLLEDRAALNILHAQVYSDIERGHVLADRSVRRQLASLNAKGSKREYIRLARTLKYYGYIQFDECTCDYPAPGTRVMVMAGPRELLIRPLNSDGLPASSPSATNSSLSSVSCSSSSSSSSSSSIASTSKKSSIESKEMSFRVTRIKCWRLDTDIKDCPQNGVLANGHSNSSSSSVPSNCISPSSAKLKLDLNFEYQMKEDELQWIKISSDQACLMSISLLGIVHELCMKREGLSMKKAISERNKMKHDARRQLCIRAAKAGSGHGIRKGEWSYLKKDGSSQVIKIPKSLSTDGIFDHSASNGNSKMRESKSHHNGFNPHRATMRSLLENENDVFAGIGDDDL